MHPTWSISYPQLTLQSDPKHQAVQALPAGGAVAMTGLTPDQDPAQNGVPLDAPPSIRQGFGRLQLNSSLPLSGVNSPAGLNLQASHVNIA